ncbi:LVIVD repeat-containing protein [Dyadobacter sp. CY312]|uniref:LVIVD repeat-containing protein n=1 Tax=Dyadobacter sp. CY312 TaxID=2907303 RepID=UPI001F3B5346|nr:hypothetical protein [Dyadobacter sp. CY312]MCE7041072.1 hypothetical protein [Dyadobacter sp. CY312]
MKILANFSLLCAGMFLFFGCESNKENSSVGPQNGVGGSMARFAITGNTLYIVSKETLEVYNISDEANPVKSTSKNMGMGIETIFPYQNHLFIGANDGMYIYNNQVPGNPSLLSKYTHIQSCDPVVVEDKYAYVTLRGGVVCRNWTSQSSLDVIDVSNPSSPKMVSSQPLLSPYGLGVSGNRLFVCEGDNGFKVMDITQPTSPVVKHHFKDLTSYDVIVRNNRLIITGNKGLFQYKYDEQDNVELLSKIPVL